MSFQSIYVEDIQTLGDDEFWRIKYNNASQIQVRILSITSWARLNSSQLTLHTNKTTYGFEGSPELIDQIEKHLEGATCG